jgi:hypothetical protein
VPLANTYAVRPSSNAYQVHCLGTQHALRSLGAIYRACVLVNLHYRLTITLIRYTQLHLVSRTTPHDSLVQHNKLRDKEGDAAGVHSTAPLKAPALLGSAALCPHGYTCRGHRAL